MTYDLMRTLRQITDEHLMAAQENLDSITIDMDRLRRPRRTHIKVINQSGPEEFLTDWRPQPKGTVRLSIDFDPYKTYHDEEELV